MRAPAQEGFTLIEMLTVLAISAVLAALAYPTFRQHVQRAERAQARTALMEAAQFMERFRGVHLRYDRTADPMAPQPVALPTALRTVSPTGRLRYRIVLARVDAGSYRLEAQPEVPESTCGALVLDQVGRKTVTGTLPADTCWR